MLENAYGSIILDIIQVQLKYKSPTTLECYQLNFDQHISNLCRKAGQQLNVLRRLSLFLSRLNKLTFFHTFILSYFNYYPLAWHFVLKVHVNLKYWKQIQERALTFVYDDFEST